MRSKILIEFGCIINSCLGFLRSRRDKRKEKKIKKKKDSSGETINKEDKSDK